MTVRVSIHNPANVECHRQADYWRLSLDTVDVYLTDDEASLICGLIDSALLAKERERDAELNRRLAEAAAPIFEAAKQRISDKAEAIFSD